MGSSTMATSHSKLLEQKSTNTICADVSMRLKEVPRRSKAVVITLIGTLSYIWRKALRDVLILLDMISRTQRYSKQDSECQSIEVTSRRERISSWATLHTFVCARILSDIWIALNIWLFAIWIELRWTLRWIHGWSDICVLLKYTTSWDGKIKPDTFTFAAFYIPSFHSKAGCRHKIFEMRKESTKHIGARWCFIWTFPRLEDE